MSKASAKHKQEKIQTKTKQSKQTRRRKITQGKGELSCSDGERPNTRSHGQSRLGPGRVGLSSPFPQDEHHEQDTAPTTNWISSESKGFALKFGTDEIQASMNLFPKNHHLELT